MKKLIQHISIFLALAGLMFPNGSPAQDAPVGVSVRFSADAQVMNGGYSDPANLVLSTAVTPSFDQPSGILYLVGTAPSNAPGTVDARPAGATGLDPKPRQHFGYLEPGKLYYVTLEGYAVKDITLYLGAPPGYEIEIAGATRSVYTVRGPLFGAAIVPVRVYRPGSILSARAGVASSIENGAIRWQVALGGSHGGRSAGALAISESGTSADWSSIFTPAALQYEPPIPEIHVERDDGKIRQILANEACVDVVALTPTSYELRFFHFKQLTVPIVLPVQTAGVRSFKGYPFVTYRIESEGAFKLKITSETRQLADIFSPDAPLYSTVIGDNNHGGNAPIARTSSTTLERTGTAPGYAWNLKDWNTVGQTQLVEENRVWGGSSGNRTEEVTVGSNVSRSTRIYYKYDWGEELVGITKGAAPTPSETTTLEYYEAISPVGSYGAVKTRTTTGGAWEAYEYHPSEFGVVTRQHRPYQGTPAAPPFDLTSNTSGEITSFSYALDAFGRLTRPTLIETRINNVQIRKSEISYTSASFGGRDTLQIVTALRKDYPEVGQFLSTITKYFQEDAGLYVDAVNGVPVRKFETFFRGRLHSITNANGAKQSFVHQLGTWNGTTFTPSANNGLDDGTASRTIVISGSATSGTLYQTFDGYDLDDLYLVRDSSEAGVIKHKSTMQSMVWDSMGRLVKTENSVWNGSGWTLISWVKLDGYDWSNQLIHAVSDNDSEIQAQYNGQLKQWTTDAQGIRNSFTYDAAGRIETATREASSNIAQLTTRFSYDAEDRLLQEVVGCGQSETLVSTASYDNAGRITSQGSPGPNGSLVTSYAYAPASRTVTATLPNGGTKVDSYLLDGSLSSSTGTGVVPEYYAYSIGADGRSYTKVQIGTWNSSRLAEVWVDGLGRTRKTSRPGFSGQQAYVETNDFDSSTGRLIQTSQKDAFGNRLYADSRYEYDTMSRMIRSGMDLNLSGSLELGSSDRISDSDSYIEQIGSDWWLTGVRKTYPIDSSSTPLKLSTNRKRLTGYSGNLRSESVEIDVDGNTTTRTLVIDRTAKTTTVNVSSTGYSIVASERYENGLSVWSRNFEGLEFSSGYDGLARPVSSTRPRTGTVTTTYRTGSTFVSSVWGAIDSSGTLGKQVEYFYDSAGRVIETRNHLGKSRRTAYNKRDQVLQEWGSAQYPVSYAYNEYGERIAMRTFRGEPEDFTTASWPLTDHGGDPANPTPSSWLSGDKTTWSFDGPSGLLVSKTTPAADPQLSSDPVAGYPQSTTYGYNSRGQTSIRTSARGIATSYSYDSLTGELLGQTYSDSTPEVNYTYRRSGDLATVQDATGSRTFVYSGSLPHQLDGVQLDGFYGSRVLTRQYDSLKRPSGFMLGSALFSSSDLLQTYAYNSLGRFESVATTSSAQALRTFSYAYNNGGLVSGLGVVSGQFGVTYGYEASRDLVTQVESKWGSAVRSRFDYTYNTLGQRITAKQSSDLTTGAFADFGGSTYFRYTYNDRGEVTQGVNYLGEDPASTSSPQLVGRRFGYDYDKIGNRVSSTRSLGTGVSDLYTSYATNQYRTRENDIGYTGGTAQGSSSVTVTGGTVPSTVGRAGRHWGAEFVPANTSSPAKVDLTVTATLAGAGSGGADLVRTATASTVIPPALQTLKYDADGNLIGDGLWTYSYDAENRLIAMQTELTAIVAITSANARRLEFKYDYLNRRVEKRVLSGWNGSGYTTELFKRRFLYDGWNLVAEISASTSALVRSYTWALDMAGSLTATGGIAALVQITDHGTGTSYLPTYDGNGNVASLVRSSDGVIAASYEYSPFGELLRCSQPASGGYAKENPFRFSTKFTDDETGLVYYGARFFDPRNGRFINRDPISEAGGLNLYGFSRNDGINGYDVLGYEPTLSTVFVTAQRGSQIGTAFGPLGTVIGGVIGAASAVFGLGKLFGFGKAAKPMPKPKTVDPKTTNVGPKQPWIWNGGQTGYFSDGNWIDTSQFTFMGGEPISMQPFFVVERQLPSLYSMIEPSLRMAAPLVANLVDQYRGNLAIGGSHFNALQMTANPVYMVMSGASEAVSGIGMDAHDFGTQLTGWGKARAIGKVAIGVAGTAGLASGVLRSAIGRSILSAAETETATFYRSMSQAHYEQLLKTGKLPATAETFISPTRAFAADYDGVLVQFRLRGGVQDALRSVGGRDTSVLARELFPNMPVIESGWTRSGAFFKAEGTQINIGLGRGKALDIFNDHIIDFTK